jgi:hypothetical protein
MMAERLGGTLDFICLGNAAVGWFVRLWNSCKGLVEVLETVVGQDE